MTLLQLIGLAGIYLAFGLAVAKLVVAEWPSGNELHDGATGVICILVWPVIVIALTVVLLVGGLGIWLRR